MGAGDMMPSGGHRRRYDPAYAKKVKEGGKKALVISQQTKEHHEKVEEPIADEELMKDLENV